MRLQFPGAMPLLPHETSATLLWRGGRIRRQNQMVVPKFKCVFMARNGRAFPSHAELSFPDARIHASTKMQISGQSKEKSGCIPACALSTVGLSSGATAVVGAVVGTEARTVVARGQGPADDTENTSAPLSDAAERRGDTS